MIGYRGKMVFNSEKCGVEFVFLIKWGGNQVCSRGEKSNE